jgi:hypothetical protein
MGLDSLLPGVLILTSQETLRVPIIKPGWLIQFKEIIAVYCEDHVTHAMGRKHWCTSMFVYKVSVILVNHCTSEP